MRTCCVLIALSLLASACGGSSPTPSPSPTPPRELWSLSGRVTAYGTGEPVAGAVVTPEGGPAVETDAGGHYRLAGTRTPATNPYRVTIDAGGFLTREVYVRHEDGDRTGVDLNVVRQAAPFSLDFYRQLVRDAYDKVNGRGLEVVSRLEESPKFYLRTVDQGGRAIEADVLNDVQVGIRKAVSDWTQGALWVTTLETGKETRERRDGWIVVNIVRDYWANYCGRAYVGALAGSIELVDDKCSCRGTRISGTVIAHEVGHAMGFYHVGDRNSLMYPYVPGNCPPGSLSDADKYHSALAYARPRGNTDPDADSGDANMARPLSTVPDVLVEN